MKLLTKALLVSPVLCLAFMEILDIFIAAISGWTVCSNYNYFNEGPAEVALAMMGILGIYFIFTEIVWRK